MNKSKIISESYKFLTKKGYSSFSYADLAKKVGITKASIHYYFPSKSDLGEEVIRQSLALLISKLANIELSSENSIDRLNSYLDLFMEDFNCSRLPLCCSLSADRENLPDGMILLMADYFNTHLNWVVKIIIQGQERHEIVKSIKAKQMALLIINLLEGANIVANALQEAKLFKNSFDGLLGLIRHCYK